VDSIDSPDNKPVKQDKRKENATQTQAALRAAGCRLFGLQGYEATSIGSICAEANVTTGALYHHYCDKRGLFAAIVEEIDANLVKAAAEAGSEVLEKGGEPWDAFLASVDVVLWAGTDLPRRRIVLTDAPAVLGAEAWEDLRQRQGLGAMTRSVQYLQACNVFGKQDPQRLARVILGLLYGAIESLPDDAQRIEAALADARRWVHAMLLALRRDISD